MVQILLLCSRNIYFSHCLDLLHPSGATTNLSNIQIANVAFEMERSANFFYLF